MTVLQDVYNYTRTKKVERGHALLALVDNGGVAFHGRPVRHLETILLQYDEEGITWCRGWSGPPVDSLRVAAALDAAALDAFQTIKFRH